MSNNSAFWLANPSTGFYPETIDQSLRFEDGDSPYLSRTFVSPTNNTTWSYSAWIKLANTGLTRVLLGGSSTNYGSIGIESNDKLTFWTNAGATAGASTALLRDTTNWYHIFVVSNGTNIKGYVNNQLLLTYTGTITNLNSAIQHQIGRFGGLSYYFDGYMAEVNFVDGTELAPTDFGEEKNSVWIPKTLSSLTYGNNGFRLTFQATGTGTTAQGTTAQTNIGDDQSGEGHNFTSSGLASTDVVPDSPTNNFCTLDSNFRAVTSNTLSEGNLKCVTSTSGRSFSAGTFLMTPNSGKWYWEFRPDANSGGMGVAKVNGTLGANQSVTSTSTSAGSTDYYYGETNWVMYGDGIVHNASYVGGTGSGMGSPSYPQIWGIGIDMDASPPTISYYIDGSSVGSADLDTGYDYIPIVGDGSGAVSRTININFGQNPTFNGTETAGTNTDGNGNGLFHDAVPTNHLALCSSNLPDTTISPNQDTQADDHFNTLLWSGNNSYPRALTGVGFQPDLVWTKTRNQSYGHGWFDSSRGASAGAISSQNTINEPYANTNFDLDSFDADGMTWTSTADLSTSNNSGDNYVAWNWKANGGTTTTNDASSTGVGTIDSVFQANTTSGFSIVTYTGTGSAGTIKHGLSVAPSLVIIKSRSGGSVPNWVIGQDKSGFTGQLYFDTGAFSTNSGSFNNTAPTTSVVSIGTDSTVNQNTINYVMYCFSNVEGFSRVGAYTGNGSTDGPLVYTGFKPAFLLIKSTGSSSNGWYIYDNKRLNFGTLVDGQLYANLANAEDDGNRDLDFLSNGFRPRLTDTNVNASGTTFVYLAYAEQPFKFSRAK